MSCGAEDVPFRSPPAIASLRFEGADWPAVVQWNTTVVDDAPSESVLLEASDRAMESPRDEFTGEVRSGAVSGLRRTISEGGTVLTGQGELSVGGLGRWFTDPPGPKRQRSRMDFEYVTAFRLHIDPAARLTGMVTIQAWSGPAASPGLPRLVPISGSLSRYGCGVLFSQPSDGTVERFELGPENHPLCDERRPEPLRWR
jgi:hypothetical protein